MRTIAYFVNLAFSLYELLVLVYCALSWLRIAENRWTVMIRRLVEPALAPIRRMLENVLPASVRMVDLSPIVLILLLSICKRILMSILFF